MQWYRQKGLTMNDYKIANGYEWYLAVPLWRVVGTNNDYVGEWQDRKADAEAEYKRLTLEAIFDSDPQGILDRGVK